MAVARQRGLQTAAGQIPAYAVLTRAGLLAAKQKAGIRPVEAGPSGLQVAIAVIPFSGMGGRKTASVSAGTTERTFALPKDGVGPMNMEDAVAVEVGLLLPLLPACGRTAAEAGGNVAGRASGLGDATACGARAVIFAMVVW